MELPDELGTIINQKLIDSNGEGQVGWLLIAVQHGQPIQTMSNLDELAQGEAAQIAANAIAAENMQTVSTLLNPEGSA